MDRLFPYNWNTVRRYFFITNCGNHFQMSYLNIVCKITNAELVTPRERNRILKSMPNVCEIEDINKRIIHTSWEISGFVSRFIVCKPKTRYSMLKNWFRMSQRKWNIAHPYVNGDQWRMIDLCSWYGSEILLFLIFGHEYWRVSRIDSEENANYFVCGKEKRIRQNWSLYNTYWNTYDDYKYFSIKFMAND